MTRFLLLVALATLPALVAAPVPPKPPSEFGAKGVLSRAELETVTFDTRAAPKRDGDRDWADDAVIEERVIEDRRKPDAPAKPRPANRYDLAVVVPAARARAGDPVYAYFVLRNNRDTTLRLGSRMDPSGGYPEFHGGGMGFDVRDRTTGKSALKGLAASTNCGGGSLVDVPADGFYCVRGDLNRVAGGLAPGEYEVDWRCGKLASAPVRFTVLPNPGAKPAAPAKPDRARFFHLNHNLEDDDEGDGFRAGAFVRDGRLSSLYAGQFESGLAVGPGGAYVPDARAIPAADALVEAWIEFKPYREGDRVAVTLRAVPPHERVRFDDLPRLYLQVLTPDRGEGAVPFEAEEKQAELKRLSDRYVTPLTLDVALPSDWRERLGGGDTARLAVVVAAKEVELPRGAGQRLQKLEEKKVERADPDAPPVWGGLVRTPLVEVRLPPPAPPVRR
ncbi:MAG: hypothetical protein FJ304_18795 [Planctomycetes bacterium]|nr:hypothetical protein [Planctomycetota bacterium]